MKATTHPLPNELCVNAWASGEPVMGVVDDELVPWAFRPRGQGAPRFLRPQPPADLADWRDPRVGWGLILPHDGELSDDKLADATDAPEPIRELLAARPGSPIFRYQPQSRLTHLMRYDPGGRRVEVVLSGADRGTAPGALPHYLLIYGSPEQIPWGLQYRLNQTAAVGRLSLTGAALERYVVALLSNWARSESRADYRTVWAVARGDSMGQTMRDVVAEPVYDALNSDTDPEAKTTFLDGAQSPATAHTLVATLTSDRPSLIVTTSHGDCADLKDMAALRRTIGSPVDGQGIALDPGELLSSWQPDGAIWYAHACCSAGADGRTAYEGIPLGWIEDLLRSIAAVGPMVAPLPEALLGAEKPLRAFVGHVEPTFDWTIRHFLTKQSLTASIRTALWDRLCQPWPIGQAFRPCYDHVGELFAARDEAYRGFNNGEDTEDVALATQLAALDRQSMVILGDPTVALPSVDGAGPPA